MRFIKDWAWPVFKWICVASIGGGVLLWLQSKGINPARWVAAALGYAENVQVTAAAWLVLAGTFGLVIPLIWSRTVEALRPRPKGSACGLELIVDIVDYPFSEHTSEPVGTTKFSSNSKFL